MSEELPLIAAIEAGGTKFVCAVGTGPHDVRDVTRIDTTTPEDTLAGVTRFLSSAKSKYGSIAAIGIGSFGPIDLDRKSETYGYITSTPKPGWQFTNIVSRLHDRYHVPIAWDTDVNAAVLGEYLWGAGQGTDPLIYITVGTGVGGGVLINGQLLHGMLHPEIGHLMVPPPQNSSAVQHACHCPFHNSCVEGYISGTSLASRWGGKADALPPDHPAWEEVADVMAHTLLNLTLSISPKRIILGGGVMSQEHILPLIRGRLHKLNNGYLRVPELGRGIDDYIVSPGLGARSGLLGALALGRYELDLHANGGAASKS